MNANPSKNDIAWQELFQEKNILGSVEKDGFFHISSEEINKKREARLMTKFDHKFQLPDIFKKHKLSIQPVSRGSYIIGKFSSYFTLPKIRASVETKYLDLPSQLESIVSQNISSESSAIMCAYLSGMLTDILEEETLFTVFGRMSTGKFYYKIYDSEICKSHKITVENSQCEIDGGFEGATKFAIIEAKCQSVDDFIIRQLYYPYRLWQSKLTKEVIPIFLSFSNNIFTFYVFKFADLFQYDSIRLESIHRYCIGQYEIELLDIRKICASIKSFRNDDLLIFPQANNFTRVIDLLDKLYFHNKPLTKDEVTTEYEFDPRQTDYYISAGIYLGLFEKLSLQKCPAYRLTSTGKEIMRLDPKRKNLELARSILSHKIFYNVLHEYLTGSERPNNEKSLIS